LSLSWRHGLMALNQNATVASLHHGHRWTSD
jgi:hypothetical protein